MYERVLGSTNDSFSLGDTDSDLSRFSLPEPVRARACDGNGRWFAVHVILTKQVAVDLSACGTRKGLLFPRRRLVMYSLYLLVLRDHLVVFHVPNSYV